VDPKRASRPGPGPIAVQKPGSPARGPVAPGRPAPAQPAQRRSVPGLQETLDQLGKDIRKLQIDFERFFNGGLPVPPDDLRARIQTQFRNLRNLNIPSAVDNFRLGDLEARFNTYNELFNRRLREREEGKHQPARVAAVEKRRYDPMAGIVVGASLDPEAVEALYQGLASGPEAPKFDLDSFQTYLDRQATALREKTGCSQVQFRLAAEDGKIKLKARPIAAREGNQ
jgi:hypothetical protein